MDTPKDDYVIKQHSQGTPTCWQYIPQKRRLLPEDPFYDDGNIHCSLQFKQMPVEIEPPGGTLLADFQCHESGCSAPTFNTVHDYETHYNSMHRNVCSMCSRTFPSSHLLDIHVMEWHDAMFDIMAQQQPMFLCLVDGCLIKFSTAEERKLHLVNEHKYPWDYRFDKRAKTKGKHTKDISIDNMSTGAPMEVTAPSYKEPSTQGTTTPNRHYRIPKNISFGRGGARAFHRTHHKPQTAANKDSMNNCSNMPTEGHSIKSNPSLPQTSMVTQEMPELTDHNAVSETMES